MEIIFRKATAKDKNALLDLLSARQEEANKLHSETGNSVHTQGAAMFDKLIGADNFCVFIGEQHGVIVATLTVYILPRIRLGGYFALFEDILVTQDLRGQGIGKQLLQFAVEKMKNDPQIKKIKLGSRKNETGLHEFYRNAGFIDKEKLFQKTL